ncbi:MAG: ABC transporter ATP-binding protein [Eubacteriales bacterium]|nr:ABC transporter ATP-binding protein [Eubacteriales bacterium]
MRDQIKEVFAIYRRVHGLGAYIFISALARILTKLCELFTFLALAYWLVSVLSGTLQFSFGWVLLSIALGFGLSYFDTYISHWVSFRIVKHLQDQVYEQLDQVAPGGLRNENTADSAALIISDVSLFEWFVAHCLIEWIGSLVLLIGSVFYLARISYSAAIVFLILALFMLIVPFVFVKSGSQTGFEMRRIFGAMEAVIADGILGEKDVVANHWEADYFANVEVVDRNYSKGLLGMDRRDLHLSSFESILSILSILLTVYLSSLALSPESRYLLLPVAALTLSMISILQATLHESSNYAFVFGAAHRLSRIFALKSPVDDHGKVELTALQNKPCRIAFRHLDFHYPDEEKQVLNGFDYEWDGAGLVAFVGASGCGKSTLAQLLHRFWDPTAGHIEINGIDIRSLRLDALRSWVTVLPQETHLMRMSLRDNLKLAKGDATEDELTEALQVAHAFSFASKWPEGLDTRLGDDGLQLSGGERQRIAIAQAYLKNPEILVLDESLSAVDQETETKIIRDLQKKREGRLSIMITHRVAAMSLADQLVFIEGGRIANVGTYQRLLTDCEDFRSLVRAFEESSTPDA